VLCLLYIRLSALKLETGNSLRLLPGYRSTHTGFSSLLKCRIDYGTHWATCRKGTRGSLSEIKSGTRIWTLTSISCWGQTTRVELNLRPHTYSWRGAQCSSQQSLQWTSSSLDEIVGRSGTVRRAVAATSPTSVCCL